MQKAQLPAKHPVDRSNQKVRIFKESEDCQIADHAEHHCKLRAAQTLSAAIFIAARCILPACGFCLRSPCKQCLLLVCLRPQSPNDTPKHIVEHDRKRHDRDVFRLTPAVKKQAGKQKPKIAYLQKALRNQKID